MPMEERAGMTECEIIGMSGGCGADCPVFIDGGCDDVEEILLMDFLETNTSTKKDTPEDAYDRAMGILG